MDNIKQLFASKISLPKKIRDTILPGQYEEDFLIRIKGTARVGEDYTQEITASVPWQKLATFLLGRINEATRGKIVREFLQAHENGEQQPFEEEFKAVAQEAADAIRATSMKICKGKVTAKLTAELVSPVGSLAEGIEALTELEKGKV